MPGQELLDQAVRPSHVVSLRHVGGAPEAKHILLDCVLEALPPAKLPIREVLTATAPKEAWASNVGILSRSAMGAAWLRKTSALLWNARQAAASRS
eukprot:15433404-Alexandrium_andersonii.AAC.1